MPITGSCQISLFLSGHLKYVVYQCHLFAFDYFKNTVIIKSKISPLKPLHVSRIVFWRELMHAFDCSVFILSSCYIIYCILKLIYIFILKIPYWMTSRTCCIVILLYL